jgi:hypothetical protein
MIDFRNSLKVRGDDLYRRGLCFSSCYFFLACSVRHNRYPLGSWLVFPLIT